MSEGLQKEKKKKTDRLVFGSWRQQDYPREASGDHVICTQTTPPPTPPICSAHLKFHVQTIFTHLSLAEIPGRRGFKQRPDKAEFHLILCDSGLPRSWSYPSQTVTIELSYMQKWFCK